MNPPGRQRNNKYISFPSNISLYQIEAINLKRYIPAFLILSFLVIYLGVSLAAAGEGEIVKNKWNYVFCMIVCLVLFLSGVIVTLVLILSGVKFMAAEGPGDRDEAKKRVIYAAVGLIFVLIAIPLVNYLTEEFLPSFECDCTSVGGGGVPGSENETLLVSIHTPVDGSEFDTDYLIEFTGSAFGGSAPYSYRWTSSVDGLIGNSNQFRGYLSAGRHTITLEVTDGAGNYGSDSITIGASVPKPPPI